jgi:hypothetical protein
VVMPSHCHVVFAPLEDSSHGRPERQVILQSLKRFTAARCNRVLGRTGRFWQAESFDRVVRGSASLEKPCGSRAVRTARGVGVFLGPRASPAVVGADCSICTRKRRGLPQSATLRLQSAGAHSVGADCSICTRKPRGSKVPAPTP